MEIVFLEGTVYIKKVKQKIHTVIIGVALLDMQDLDFD
jgi:hypothetical protein